MARHRKAVPSRAATGIGAALLAGGLLFSAPAGIALATPIGGGGTDPGGTGTVGDPPGQGGESPGGPNDPGNPPPSGGNGGPQGPGSGNPPGGGSGGTSGPNGGGGSLPGGPSNPGGPTGGNGSYVKEIHIKVPQYKYNVLTKKFTVTYKTVTIKMVIKRRATSR
jgi:hypothetical protein